MRKRKRRGLPKAKNTTGFDQFNELQPLTNKMNMFAIRGGYGDVNTKSHFTGRGWTIYNYIRHGDGHILVNMTTTEAEEDPKSGTGMRRTKIGH